MGFSYNVSVLNQKGSPAIYTDTFANRPTFGYAGRLFIANDTSAIYEDTGTSWVLIANVSSGAGTLQQVTTNGNTSNVGISITAGGLSTNSLTDTALTNGSVLFSGPGGLISQDNTQLFWDDTNNRLGINTNTPGNSLDVHSSGTNPILALNNTAGSQSAISFLNTAVAKWRIGNTAINSFDIYNFTLAAYAMTISSASNAVEMSGTLNANEFNLQPNGYSLLASLSRNLTGAGYGVLTLRNSANGTIQPSSLTVDRTYTLPDATGTIALTSNLSAYLPLTGGTLTGTLNGTSANFSSNSCIGTSTPVSRLTIQAPVSANPNTGGLSFNLSNGATYFTIGVDNTSGDGALLAGSGGAIRFHTNSNMATTGEAMRLSSGRNLLIGTTTDDTVNKLQVTGSAKITSTLTMSRPSSGITLISMEGSSSYGDTSNLNFCDNRSYIKSTILVSAAGDTDLSFATQVGGTVAERFYVNAAGSFKINNLAGTGSRAVLADSTGVLSAPVSDQSVKQNIEPLKYGLETILKLNAVQFQFIEGYKNYGEGLQIGAIAQEVEQIIPEAVFTTPSTGLKGINYDQLNGIYIKAIQDQQKIIESLIKRIELLENK